MRLPSPLCEGRTPEAFQPLSRALSTALKTTWILVADSSRAKIFEVRGATRDVHEIEAFVHPEGRAHNRDLKSDASGRYYGKGEQNQGHAATKQVEPQEHEAELFAKRLTDHLEKARATQRFESLHLIAPSKFLGLIRRHLAKEAQDLVEATLAKEVAWFDERSIAEYIRRHDK
ncbi:MAG: host attachment protein [Betaproteobacteria bacterium]|nr:MAG: host attachment protein [Betaproteobacteria bacterium]